MEKCKKCLLLEAGESVTYEDIQRYIRTLDESLLTDENEYKKRINECKKCDNLISGTCLKCGCYVEVRARLKNKRCPDVNNMRW